MGVDVFGTWFLRTRNLFIKYSSHSLFLSQELPLSLDTTLFFFYFTVVLTVKLKTKVKMVPAIG